MRNELNHIEEIENYLEGRLSENEKSLFENRMMNDDVLREEVTIQKQIADRIRVNSFKSELAAFHLAYTNTPSKKFALKTIIFNSLIALACLSSAVAAVYYVSTLDSKKQEVKQISQALPVKDVKTPDEVEPVKEDIAVTSPVAPLQAKILVDPPFVPDVPVKNEVRLFNDDELYRNFTPVFTSVEMDADKGTDTIQMAVSKSFIHFPGGILVDKNGNTVKGKVELRYREYNDPAQMAFSKTNSIWSNGENNFALQTAGMFEVRVFKGNEELKIKDGKSFKIDYNVKQKSDSCYFLALNATTQQWSKVKKVEIKQKSSETITRSTQLVLNEKRDKGESLGKVLVKAYDAETGVVLEFISASFSGTPTAWYATKAKVDSGYRALVEKPGTHELIVRAQGYRKMKVKDVKIIRNKVSIVKVKLMPRSRKKDADVHRKAAEGYMLSDTDRVELIIQKRKKEGMKEGMIAGRNKAEHIYLFRNGASYIIKDSVWNAQGGVDRKLKNKGYKTVGNWVLREEPKKNENSGNVKDGLVCASTGVYYCNKVVSAGKIMSLKARYLDENKKMIAYANRVGIIDLKAGNVFTANVDEIIKTNAPRIVVLMTSEKRLYAMNETDYVKAMHVKTGEQVLVMKEITNEVRNWEELENFLNK